MPDKEGRGDPSYTATQGGRQHALNPGAAPNTDWELVAVPASVSRAGLQHTAVMLLISPFGRRSPEEQRTSSL